MSSNLMLLDGSGALAEIFKIERIDTDVGIIDRSGYIDDINGISTYINGAYDDNFGKDVFQVLLSQIHMKAISAMRLEDSNQAFVKLHIVGLPFGMEVGFRYPKEYTNG